MLMTRPTRTRRQKAWDELWETLRQESVCYEAPDGSGELRPRYSSMNYGEAVSEAVENLAKTKLTVEQVELVERLCRWVARAAHHGNG